MTENSPTTGAESLTVRQLMKNLVEYYGRNEAALLVGLAPRSVAAVVSGGFKPGPKVIARMAAISGMTAEIAPGSREWRFTTRAKP